LNLEHYQIDCDNCDYKTNIWCPVESCLGFLDHMGWNACNGHPDHLKVDRNDFNWLFKSI
jgi:hypothetical protein